MNTLDIKHETFGDYSYVTADEGKTFWRGCQRCGGGGHYSFNGLDSICYLCNNSPADRLGKFVGDRAAAEKDAAVRAKGVAKRAEHAATAATTPVVTGRVEITGQIVSIKRVFSDYGDAVKVLVKDDRGFKVYGSLAKSLVEDLWGKWYDKVSEDNGGEYPSYTYGSDVWFEDAKGVRITFTATVEASNDDVAFGFFKRPLKGSVVA